MPSGYSDIQRVLYNLKSQFPTTVYLVFYDAEVMNWDTGLETPSDTKHLVKKAILLPSTFSNLNPLTGGPFKDSGGLEIGERVIIIDAADLRGLEITKAAKVVFDDQYWDIVKVTDLNKAGFTLVLREIQGSQND